MSRINDQHDDWDALMQTWQSEVTTPPDLEALQHEVSRRSRRMRMLRFGELVVAAAAVGNCVRAFFEDSNPIPATVLMGLIGLVLGYTVWVLWQRRRQWQARALDPQALIDFELARTRTSIHIWRVSTWISMGLWVGLTLWGIAAMHAGPGPGSIPAPVWVLNITANAGVVLASAGLGLWLGQRCRRRLARLRALRDALDPE